MNETGKPSEVAEGKTEEKTRSPFAEALAAGADTKVPERADKDSRTAPAEGSIAAAVLDSYRES